MADKKKMAKLIRTSQEASKAKAQHILLTLTEENLIRIDGSAKFVEAMASNVGLFNDVKLMMLNNVAQPDEESDAFFSIQYPKLPFPPSSIHWKGSVRIRTILRKMLATLGYGKNGNLRLGKGAAPLGWPVDISWAEFAGTTRSGLTIQQITRVIVSMLEAVGLDAETHVRQEEDMQELEEIEQQQAREVMEDGDRIEQDISEREEQVLAEYRIGDRVEVEEVDIEDVTAKNIIGEKEEENNNVFSDHDYVF